MNMKQKAKIIYRLPISNKRKIKLLNDIIIDCYNEMEAQDQNMRPDFTHNVAEGYRLAKNYVRRLIRV
jgi:hypothetical protein